MNEKIKKLLQAGLPVAGSAVITITGLLILFCLYLWPHSLFTIIIGILTVVGFTAIAIGAIFDYLYYLYRRHQQKH